MKRLVIVILLIGLIYIFAQMTFDQIKVYQNKATLLLSGINSTEIIPLIKNHINTEILKDGQFLSKDAVIGIQAEYVDEDNLKDVIATIQSDDTCGSGGCLTSIYVQDEIQGFRPINFAFAVKEIEVKPSITNHMHDISINGNIQNFMSWDGNQYVLNTY
jgi:hypothetical protein